MNRRADDRHFGGRAAGLAIATLALAVAVALAGGPLAGLAPQTAGTLAWGAAHGCAEPRFSTNFR